MTQLVPGQFLYKYKLHQQIGSGAFGQVWLAVDTALDKEFAIKILKPEISIHEKLREAKIGHILTHKNLVRIHQADVATHGGQKLVILAMDYMQKGSIKGLVNSSLFLPLPDVIRAGREILSGLEYLHGENMFHNDVKPENILVGSGGQSILTDYGIVGVSKSGGPVPPPDFYKIHAAPEVIKDNLITAQSDVFQVGLTLFRLLAGLKILRQKFTTMGEQGYYTAVSKERLISTSDFPPHVPSRMRQIILKALSKNLENRYETALDMRRALEKLAFPGYWTITPSGNFIGHNGDYKYGVIQGLKPGGKYKIEAFRENKKTRQKTRCAKFCATNLTSGAAEKQVGRFIKAVVEKTRP